MQSYAGIKKDELVLSEAARLTNLAHQTLTVQARLGRLKARKAGNLWLVSRSDLNAYLERVGRPTITEGANTNGK